MKKKETPGWLTAQKKKSEAARKIREQKMKEIHIEWVNKSLGREALTPIVPVEEKITPITDKALCACGNMAGKKVNKHTGERCCRRCMNKGVKLKTKIAIEPKKRKSKFVDAPTLAKRYSKDLRKKATPAEKRFKELLRQCGIKCKFQRVIHYSTSFYIIDFYISSLNLCVELDGGYHLAPEQQAKDLERDSLLNCQGYNTIRFTNEEVFKMTRESLLKSLDQFKPLLD